MPAEGGPARRMTWLGPDVMVRGFTPDGRILFVTTHGQPFFRNYRAYTLGVDGGLPELLPYGQVNHLSFGPGNGPRSSVATRPIRRAGSAIAAAPPATCGSMPTAATSSGAWANWPATSRARCGSAAASTSCPIARASAICTRACPTAAGSPGTPTTRTSTPVTPRPTAPASSTSAAPICGCSIRRPTATRRLDIRVPAHRTQAARRFVPAADHLEGFDLHPQGHSLALGARGKLFSFALWEGAVRQHGAAQGVRYRLGRWLADGASQVVVSDASGEERIELDRGRPAPARSTGTSAA
jgi:tricorn protease